jgi:DNA-binding PadR family transcriptional regulator
MMQRKRDPHSSFIQQQVLLYMLRKATPMHGLEIYRALKRSSGTVYPILDRFEERGWVKSRWENIDPSREGRPARRIYRLTAKGKNQANIARDMLLDALGYYDEDSLLP